MRRRKVTKGSFVGDVSEFTPRLFLMSPGFRFVKVSLPPERKTVQGSLGGRCGNCGGRTDSGRIRNKRRTNRNQRKVGFKSSQKLRLLK